MTLRNDVTKTVIVTGGNAGLGYACASTIAAANQGWHIIVASRDASRGATAVQQLRRDTGVPTIDAMTLDLASLASVRAFTDAFRARALPPLQAIVCNAGTQVLRGTSYTSDGFETTFGVNHLGHFLLVNLLL
ncbi:MAG: SDR family NAD(P)-dependent oxidoreductase, partial [Chloroflexales bacterium]|nr:SDR family NAD(P)-dependent oxidoreductase [Chloroflexales bacterium]